MRSGSRPCRPTFRSEPESRLHDDTLYEGRPDWPTWFEAAKVSDIDGDRGLHFNHGNLAINAAVDGQGVVLSMRALASGDIAAGRLVTPFNIALPLEYAYYLITLEELTDHPHIAAFRDWLLEEAQQEDELNSSQKSPAALPVSIPMSILGWVLLLIYAIIRSLSTDVRALVDSNYRIDEHHG